MRLTKSIFRSGGATLGCLVCAMWLSGCLQLDDVSQLSKLADSAQQILPVVVADISASCARQNLLLSDIPAAERPSSLAGSDCHPYQSIADHLEKDQNALVDYFDALGKLASNLPPPYDQSIDANVTSIDAIPGLSSKTIAASTAAQTLMKLVADEATAGFRRRKLDSLIVKADPAVQELTSDLKRVIMTDYAGILSNERSTLDVYYLSPIAAAKPTERLDLMLVRRQYEGDQAALQSKIAATAAYGNAMDSLASLHAKLVEEVTKKTSPKEIARALRPDIENLKTAIAQMQKELK